MKCKKCRSENVSTERRIDGNHICLDCGYVWKNEDADNEIKISKEEAEVLLPLLREGGNKIKQRMAELHIDETDYYINQLVLIKGMIKRFDNQNGIKTIDNKTLICDMGIEWFGRNTRIWNCLNRAGIRTLGELLDKTENEVLCIRNLGRKSFDCLVSELRRIGLELKSEVCDG